MVCNRIRGCNRRNANPYFGQVTYNMNTNKTEIEQFHELANLTKKMDKSVNMSADAIISLDVEIRAIERELERLRDIVNRLTSIV